MIVRLIDRREIRVNASQAKRISELLDSGVEWLILPVVGRIRSHQIIGVENERSAYPVKETTPLLSAPATELSDERREHNLKKLEEMREKFMKRKEK